MSPSSLFDPSPDCDNSLANEEQIHPEGYNWGYRPLKKMGEYHESETDSPGLRHAINHLRFVG